MDRHNRQNQGRRPPPHCLLAHSPSDARPPTSLGVVVHRRHHPEQRWEGCSEGPRRAVSVGVRPGLELKNYRSSANPGELWGTLKHFKVL